MKTGIELIAQERKEQVEKHLWTTDHDNLEHSHGELIVAAMAVAYAPEPFEADISDITSVPAWAYEIIEKKKGKPFIERLAVAGALIAAEIDRLNSEPKAQGSVATTANSTTKAKYIKNSHYNE